jgi:Ca2+/Na+ antiporter
MKNQNRLFAILSFLSVALVLRFVVVGKILLVSENVWTEWLAIFLIFAVGMGYIFNGTVKVIEETTDVLKDRTGLAGGLLQAFGTAFPDMIVGIMAAIVSLQVRDTDYPRAVNLAIVAASATFGSNIYNIIHAVWCVWRQNLSDMKDRSVAMFPGLGFGGRLKPLREHEVRPSAKEIDNAISILTALTLLTAFVVVSMVLFGQVPDHASYGMKGDLYQLVRPVGFVLFILCAAVLFYFRKSERSESMDREVVKAERYYAARSTGRIWFDLALSGLAILLTAESMVRAIEVFSELASMPFVISGILAGFIGCFGEMMVVHNFSVNPNGRISDAISGVAMDNIFTTLAAAIVAIMGGIFLGGNALILIFIIILAANTVLIREISLLRNKL